MKLDLDRLCWCGTHLYPLRDAYTMVMKGKMQVPVCNIDCFRKIGVEHTRKLIESPRVHKYLSTGSTLLVLDERC